MSIATNTGPVIPEFSITHRLKLARETTGKSQQEFADETGLSRRTVSAVESGEKSVGRKELNLWQMATGVPREWLETGKYTPRDLNPEPTD